MTKSHDQYLSGFYTVGEQVYTHKKSALVACKNDDQWPTWNFFNQTFSQQDWQVPCSQDIRQVYQERARSLRSKYDWLSISFSGGSDSFTMLKAFLDADVFIDEIYVRWPFSALENYTPSRDPGAGNIHSELALSILPQLDWFSNSISTKTIISMVDWSQSIKDYQHTASKWGQFQDYFNIALSLKIDAMPPGFLKSLEQGKKSCIVLGIDKPQMCVQDNKIYSFFLDKIAHNHPHAPWDNYSEFFFWSCDNPGLVVAQAQKIYQHIHNQPDLYELIDHSRGYDPKKKEKWEAVVRKIVYPDYDSNQWFNAHKPSSMIFPETDQWIYEKYQDTKLVQSWHNMYESWFADVPERFLEHDSTGVSGFVGFTSPLYLLGPCNHEI